jgi:hypothetical protein
MKGMITLTTATRTTITLTMATPKSSSQGNSLFTTLLMRMTSTCLGMCTSHFRFFFSLKARGLQVFMSSAFEGHGHGDKHYSCNHGIDYTMHAEDTVLENDVAVVSGGISAQREGQQLTVYDFSITKSVFGMLFILSVMVWMFISIAKFVQKEPGQSTEGNGQRIGAFDSLYSG